MFIVDETYAAAGLSLTMKSELVWARRTQINMNSPTYEQIVTVLYTSYQFKVNEFCFIRIIVTWQSGEGHMQISKSKKVKGSCFLTAY